MLGIHRLTTRGADYYLADLAQELPLAAGAGHGRGEWVGSAAVGLSLLGGVDPEELRAVLDGRHPATGHHLRSERATVLGYDLTFSAPKSVSLLFALGGKEMAREVQAAHLEAVGGAVSYVEHHGLGARRGWGEGREVVATTGAVAASFAHGVSRNLDPHLHSHVVMANLVHGLDGQWGACDQRGLSAHRVAAAAVYDAHLRAALSTSLGVQWSAGAGAGDGNGNGNGNGNGMRAEVRGMSALLMGEFSSRAADIRRHSSAWGSHSARGAHVAWAATRPPKQAAPSYDRLSAQWVGRARAVDGDGCRVETLLDRAAPGRAGGETVDEHRFAAVLSLSPDGAARRRDVVAAFATSAVGGVRAADAGALTDLWLPPGPERNVVGVAEAAHPLRTVVPGGYLVRSLGPRPIDPADHEIWHGAAGAIEAYRRRWGESRSREALGVAPTSGLARLPADQLVDRLRTARQIEVARQRLGLRPPRLLEVDRGR